MIDLNSFIRSVNFASKKTAVQDLNDSKSIRITLSWGHLLDLICGRSLRFKAGGRMIEVRYV